MVIPVICTVMLLMASVSAIQSELTYSSCSQIMREGTDVSLIAFGKLVGYSLEAAEILEKEGISCEVCLQFNFLPFTKYG